MYRKGGMLCAQLKHKYVLYSGKILNVMDLLGGGIALYGTPYIISIYILE